MDTSRIKAMTKREKFAMAAMQAIISNREYQLAILKDRSNGFYPDHIKNLDQLVAFESINFADELIKQLENEN